MGSCSLPIRASPTLIGGFTSSSPSWPPGVDELFWWSLSLQEGSPPSGDGNRKSQIANPHCPMGLLDSEAGKRRLLTVEVPVIERYNEGRDPAYKIQLVRLGSTLVLRYRLKPVHNVYQLETRLVSSYPTVPPETRVLTPLKHCPHLLEGQTLCLWRQGSTRATSRWDPARFSCIFAVQAAWRGLACYEIWHDTGEWPLPEAK